MQLKPTKLIAAVGVALAAISSAPAHAGALAMSDLNISQLFLADGSGNPLAANASIKITNESRTGTANANYNGVSGSGSSLTSNVIGGTVDPVATCVGPSCGTVAGSLYGGSFENNTTTHVSPPPSANYALGDVLIKGSAIGGSVTGLTRSDAAAIGPSNFGGGNATLLNTATVTSTFQVGTSFSGQLAATGNAYFNLWVDNVGASNEASAGMSWIVTIRCTAGVSCSNLNGGKSSYTFQPDEFNFAASATDPSANVLRSTNSTVFGGTLLNFLAGNTYSLSINQATNATVVSLPEPASMALVGISLMGLGFAGYRRSKKG